MSCVRAFFRCVRSEAGAAATAWNVVHRTWVPDDVLGVRKQPRRGHILTGLGAAGLRACVGRAPCQSILIGATFFVGWRRRFRTSASCTKKRKVGKMFSFFVFRISKHSHELQPFPCSRVVIAGLNGGGAPVCPLLFLGAVPGIVVHQYARCSCWCSAKGSGHGAFIVVQGER